MIPTKEENPNGLHGRYNVTKADGTPCDDDTIYFRRNRDAVRILSQWTRTPT